MNSSRLAPSHEYASKQGKHAMLKFNVARVQCNTLQAQYSTVQYSTVLYSTVQYSTVQYSTVQYNTVLQILRCLCAVAWLAHSVSTVLQYSTVNRSDNVVFVHA